MRSKRTITTVQQPWRADRRPAFAWHSASPSTASPIRSNRRAHRQRSVRRTFALTLIFGTCSPSRAHKYSKCDPARPNQYSVSIPSPSNPRVRRCCYPYMFTAICTKFLLVVESVTASVCAGSKHTHTLLCGSAFLN